MVRCESDGEMLLPRKGYQTLCVEEDLYKYIQKVAKESNGSTPEYIKYLIERDQVVRKYQKV